MKSSKLFVFSHIGTGFVPAGRLTLTEDIEVSASAFSYGLRYLKRADRIEIDPVSLALDGMAQTKGQILHPANALSEFGGIRDAAPDAWGRRVIEALRNVPANSLPESAYLLAAGSDRVGALDIRETLDSPPVAGANSIRDLDYLLEATERIEQGLPIPANLADIIAPGASAGGARPKSSIRDEDGCLWLAKFPSHGDRFSVADAEHFTLTLAAECGLRVPAVKVLDIGGKRVMLIRRFDRYWSPPGQIPDTKHELHLTMPATSAIEQRLPFVSGLTLTGCAEQDSPLKSYADLAEAIRRHCHPSLIAANREELFARMVFNIFVSNDDDHLRNHGFVRDPRVGGWRLSPLYDVLPHPGIAYERRLHLDIGHQGKLATLDNAMSTFSAFTPHRGTALAIMHRIWRVLRQWQMHAESWGVSTLLINALTPAFRRLDDIASPSLRNEIRRHAGE